MEQIAEKHWSISSIDPDKITQLSEQLNIEPLLAKLLILKKMDSWGLPELQRFLDPQNKEIYLFENISDELNLKKACERIAKAIKQKETIMINGDPDADGITGTVVLDAGLTYLGAKVVYDFPTRSKEGHGLQPRIIDHCEEKKIPLIITIDCGTKDVEAVNYANQMKIDVIICDHHILGEHLPQAYAFINPYLLKRKTSEQELCGSLIAFKFILAIAHHLGVTIEETYSDYLLSVSSLGALSDRVSLLEPMNRIMIKKGINILNTTKMEGLKALKCATAGYETLLKPSEASRAIVPRINAPGRIGDPEEDIPDSKVVVDLLLLGTGKKNAKKANKLLKILKSNFLEQKKENETEDDDLDQRLLVIESINERRKHITQQIEEEIEYKIQDALNQNDRIIIIRGLNWHSGVIGIDADRIKERFLKPVIIFTGKDGSDYLRASVRSIPKINMYAKLDIISDAYEKKFNKKLFCIEVQTHLGKETVNSFGGHPQACGFSIHKDNVEMLINEIYKAINQISQEKFQFTYDILDTIGFPDLTPKFFKKFDKLEPFGQKFELPIFLLRHCSIGKARPFGSKRHAIQTPHIEFVIESASGPKKTFRSIKAVGFGLNKKYQQLVTFPEFQRFDIVFTLDLYKKIYFNKGKRQQQENLVMTVLDIRRST